MKMLIIFYIISIVINVISLYYAINLYYKETRGKRILSSLQIYTIGLFFSVVSLFIPIYYTAYDFGDKYAIIRPFLLSVHSSLRIFILDGDYTFIKNSLNGQPELLRVLYSFYCVLLYVIAPIMTFTNVLFLFRDIVEEIRFWYHKHKKIYVMSELNQKSVALAKSIRDMDRKAIIVFTDVFSQNEEDDYELLTQVRDIKGICLKRDVTHLNIINKKGNVEIFLIGEDESENVSQAVKITTELNSLNKKHNVKIFVFSSKDSSAYILDSIRYKNLLEFAGKNDYDDSTFKLRRIDEIRQLAWNTVSNMKVFETAQNNDNTISVLIAGMGSYGMEFFKALVWFCQFEGYKLKITVIDKFTDGEDGKITIKSIINHQCTDLLKHNMSTVDGDSYYDIEILSGIDLKTSDFEELALYSGNDEKKHKLSQRIKETNIAIISLGDDDLNIETAVEFRKLFDRIHTFKAKKDLPLEQEKIQIYSVVYDDQKSGILHCNDNVQEATFLLNHKDVPYHIHFIGGMSSQFNYSNVYDAKLEKKAFEHHVGWVEIEERIYNEWKEKEFFEKINDNDWYFKDEKTDDAMASSREKYEKYEYYRLSSIAKELYKKAVSESLSSLSKCTEDESRQTCVCENCVRRKKSEHMRWNAYTRCIGYSYKEGIRADRAKVHDNLVGWDKLSELDKLKD